ncbi:hypothetical protein AB0B94_31230 [Micromonospora sp. NPDC048986]|uniref:hypothetical protein n=1 Tax=Micromonospora sp. NPDC048986 TaxID=3155644 RepID=UPI0033DF2801
MPVVITGASDDLIEVDGDISAEFTYKDEDQGDLLAFSDGTLIRITFIHGIWRITPAAKGSGNLTIELQNEDEDTDTATLDGDVRWVVHGQSYAKSQA